MGEDEPTDVDEPDPKQGVEEASQAEVAAAIRRVEEGERREID